MNNGDKPATASKEYISMKVIDRCIEEGVEAPETVQHLGLTKREHFAAMAMQGLLANHQAIQELEEQGLTPPAFAVMLANGLLKSLEETK